MERTPVTWLYRPANIDPDVYHNEMMALLQHYVPDLQLETSPHFLPITEHTVFKQLCPDLYAKICSWDLGDRLAELSFIIIPPQGHFPIHRDYPRWTFRNIGLLMPVLNCAGSYTAIYDAQVVEDTLGGIVGDNAYAHRAQRVDESQARELVRVPSDTANWINVFQPHAPVVTHDQYRVTFSIRFRPELFDYFENGRFEQELVRHA